MSIFKGDFLGFTFNSIHSSEIGIVRVNLGDRAVKDLSPQIKDNTIDVPGSDGIYFLNSQYQQMQFQVDFAFDNVTELNIKSMRILFGDNNLHTLIFDEEPYRAYEVKVTSPVKLNYICFDEKNGVGRIYKGEGNVTFTAFYPFAKAPYKTWPSYVNTTIGNYHYDKNGVCVEEWLPAANLKETLTGYDTFVNAQAIPYNPGTIPTPLSLILQVKESGYFQIKYTEGGDTKGVIIIDTSKLIINNYYYLDAKTRLLKGGTMSSGKFIPENFIYNEVIIAGDFFSINPTLEDVAQRLVCSDTTTCLIDQLLYDYLYM